MMKKMMMGGIVLFTVAISSCDTETTTMGNSLTIDADRFTIITDTFDVATQSIKVDSVLSRSTYTYLGRIKDPETGAYITSDFSTQFHILENETNLFPNKEYILGLDDDGLPVADSCFVNIMINSYQGDSLTAMKLMLRELESPVKENKTYYTDFSPAEKGYLRTDANALKQNKIYSISDLTLSDSLRAVYRGSAYYEYIKIPLNKPYTAKDGTRYKNYGTYLLRTYYDHPEYFKNSSTFAHYVCPGFYIETIDGLGVMSEVAYTQLQVYFRYQVDDVQHVSSRTFNATQEVLQTTHIKNDKESIKKLVEDETCTYLKTPAGIFTEVTLPVDEIIQGRLTDNISHINDTITSAKISFSRMNVQNELSDIVLEEPTSLLMVERDSMYTFFEKNMVPDDKTSFVATYNSTLKTYSFNNISTLINAMYHDRRNKSVNWNKVVLIPVQLTTTTTQASYYYTATTTVTGVSNEMNINSVRLVGGSNNQHAPVRISVIYNTNE